ncbi:maleylpyruvate isomerase N-terminal domain-containing protein [Micromonospora purpureochromogenes]|uniref:Mycothiol-dependent maleylpyruvate isomerase metal-binding domain-containing protein n=1 Tax=Micromonospora purpureochromogenes TaxID=47872 RepID=A0ABX2RMZ6_9ACTN|nr:hypothetical protein [Micromonospora purpureochromogenes]NYF57885.1 hypothetical protein [Micromonospora purpureochromogenes]
MIFPQQRQDYFGALDWVTQLMAATQPRQLDARTPCENFDVRSMLGHLIGTAHRGVATARGIPTRDIPHVITDVSDSEFASTYTANDEIVWENHRYYALYVVDRPSLLQGLTTGVPVVHLGQRPAVDAVTAAVSAARWFVVYLWCPRGLRSSELSREAPAIPTPGFVPGMPLNRYLTAT